MTFAAPRRGPSGLAVLVPAGLASLLLYAALAAAGDLRAHAVLYLAAHAALCALMLAAWRAAARGGRPALVAILAGAIAFRAVMAAAPPSLSDDVFRHVWDGRLEAAFHDPYKYAPADPMRAEFRDAAVYPRIRHPEIVTLDPPLAEMLFGGLALLGCGVAGFKAAMAALDVGAVLALLLLLRAIGAPRDRVVLYAWNPLAIVETAGSGHAEPLGIALLLLAVAWLSEGRGARAAAALGGAIQAKLLPLLLVPGFVRRLQGRSVLVLVATVLLIDAPYAVRGPAYGAGILAYAHRFEHGSIVYPAFVRAFAWLGLEPSLEAGIAWAQGRWGTAGAAIWGVLSRSIRPDELARIAVGALALGWAVAQSFRRGLKPADEARLALGGALLLAPTLNPWYVLWVLPLAAARAAHGWVLLAALIPLQALSGPGEAAWPLRLAIVVPPLAWMARDAWRARRVR